MKTIGHYLIKIAEFSLVLIFSCYLVISLEPRTINVKQSIIQSLPAKILVPPETISQSNLTEHKSKVAHERIQQAIDDRALELNLSDLQLEEIPPEVFQLTQLEKLNLSRNRLVKIPAEIFQLSNLKEFE
ncbi:MAG: hypothetical protein AAFY63_10895 [Cyanobacteria bacterium J06643_13]